MNNEERLQEQIFKIQTIVEEFEKKLDWRTGGDVVDKTSHVLNQFRHIADNAIYSSKNFLEDVKTQFKALQIIMEGLTGDLNHGQKRTIANHVITMLRSMVDKIDQTEFKYSSSNFDRYDFFRTQTPERTLHEERRQLSDRVKNQQQTLDEIKEKHPDIFKQFEERLPF